MAVEPERFCTACEMISMKGNPVLVPRAVEMSPMQNKTAISMEKPRAPLSAMLMIMLRGTTVEAFAISSHMWTAPSAPNGSINQEEDTRPQDHLPRKAYTEVMIPTKKVKPKLSYPPPFKNCWKTSEADPWGA